MKQIDSWEVKFRILDKLYDEWHIFLLQSEGSQLTMSLPQGQTRFTQRNKPFFCGIGRVHV
ncbi:MAG: hypothetical protein VW804_02855, partial [Verrucomicrobiota bacterium]